jgi:Ribonuclease G/E
MALSKAFVREVFSGAGADPTKIPEAVDKIVEGNVASIDALREEITDLKTKLKTAEGDSGRLKDVQKELDDLKAKVEADNKAREGKDYDALKKEFDDYKAEREAQDTRAKKETAFRGLLKDLNISDKGAKLAVKYQDFGAIELDEEGKVKDATALRKSLKEDWGDYIVQEKEEGADTKTPPGSETGGNGGKTREEIMAIKDRAERQKAIADNIELFQ